MTDKDKAFINNPTPTIQEEVLTLRIENAELKAKLKGFENGDVAWQGDMDKTIKQNLELKEQNELLSKRITELQADKGRFIDENSLTRVLIDRCKELGIKDLYHLKDLLELAEENAELEELIEIQYAEKQTLGNNNSELLKKLGTYNEQVEKMKNFYNCAHSNRALCPNEHNCKGCKDWVLAE